MKNPAYHLRRIRNGILLAICLLGLGSGTAGGAHSLADMPPDQPVVAQVYYISPANLEALAAELDIWEVHHDQAYLIALLRPEDFKRLITAGYTLSIDHERTAELYAPHTLQSDQLSGIPNYGCYRTVEETYTTLSNLAATYPNLTHLIDIGNSWEKVTPGGAAGYDIYAIVLTNHSIPGPKPAFFLMAAIHAREYTTAELATRFAEDLLSRYNSNADATWLLDNYEVHIVPMSNPDGRKFAEAGNLWRKNTDNDDGCSSSSYWGSDLNRNYSFEWGGPGASTDPCNDTYRGSAAASEPEVTTIQNYILNLFPDQRGGGINDPAPADATGIFISLHSYSELVLWPWGSTSALPPNSNGLQTLGRKFAYFNGYDPGQSVGLYPTSGTSDEWAYGELGVAAYTFEMGTTFFQGCADFESSIYPDNLEALYYAFKAARRPYQNPAGPETLDVTLISNANRLVTVQATANDQRYGGSGEATQNIAAARYSLDLLSWQNGVTIHPMTAADGSFNGKEETIQTSLDITCLAPGRHTVYVESQDAAGNWGVPGAAFLQVAEMTTPQWLPETQSLFGSPGGTLTYTLEAINPSGNADTYTVTLQNEGWTSTLSLTGNTLSLSACDSQAFTLTVNIPATALAGESNAITLTLASHTNPSQQAVASLFSKVPSNTDPTVTPTPTRTPTPTATPTLSVTPSKVFLPVVKR